MGPDLGARGNGRRKADSIQTVVDTHPHATSDLNCLPQKVAEQGKREETVRNRRAVGGIPLSTFGIDVNPLPVLRDFPKLLNSVLGNSEPLPGSDFPPN